MACTLPDLICSELQFRKMVRAWMACFTSSSGVATIPYIIDGGGSAIATGVKPYFKVDFDCTIQGWTALAGPADSGSISIDLWRTTYSSFDAGSTHPVAGDKISASAPIAISSGTKNTDSTLSGWTTSLSAGDILALNVASVSGLEQVTIALKVLKT